MANKLLSLLCIILISGTFSCIFDKAEEDKSKASSIEVLEFSKTNFEKKFGDCSNPDSLCYELNIQNIEVKGGPVEVRNSINNELNSYLITTLGGFLSDDAQSYQDLKQCVEALVQDYKRISVDFEDFNQDWNISIDTELKNKDDEIISILSSVESYLGGAHGNHWNDFLNFDARNGKMITWKDLITDEIRFTKIAEADFRLERKLPTNADLEREGYFFDEGVFKLPENIGFSEQGVILIYNPYEVAPYSMGSIEFIIPWEEIRSITTKQ